MAKVFHSDRSSTISTEFHEDKDCAVLALSRVLNISYENAHQALAEAGRDHRDGTQTYLLRKALRSFGYQVLRTLQPSDLALLTGQPHVKRITTAHPIRGLGHWDHLPPMLLFTAEHVAAFRDGEVLDWTSNKNAPIQYAWEIRLITDTVPVEELPPVIYLRDRSR